MKTINITNWDELPNNFTGVVDSLTKTKYWYKEGKLHRTDGPAVKYLSGYKEWYVEDVCYESFKLQSLIQTSIYFGKKQKGNYNLDWLMFLTEKGIEEFPIIPEMEKSYISFLLASLD